jgi:hypothetical protein
MDIHIMNIGQKLANRINHILLIHEVLPIAKHSGLQYISRYPLTRIVPEIDLKVMRSPPFPFAAEVTGRVDDFLGV